MTTDRHEIDIAGLAVEVVRKEREDVVVAVDDRFHLAVEPALFCSVDREMQDVGLVEQGVQRLGQRLFILADQFVAFQAQHGFKSGIHPTDTDLIVNRQHAGRAGFVEGLIEVDGAHDSILSLNSIYG